MFIELCAILTKKYTFSYREYVAMPCKDGLHFDVSAQVCNYPELANCGGRPQIINR